MVIVTEEKRERAKLRRIVGRKRSIRDYQHKRTSKQAVRYAESVGEAEGYIDPQEETSLSDIQEYALFEQQQPKLTEKEELIKFAASNPISVRAEINKRDLKEFVRYFWDVVAHDDLVWNWHMNVLCDELMRRAGMVAAGETCVDDLIVNVPPGTTKSLIVSVFFPVWCWTCWPWMRFICASYSAALSLEQADYSREVVRSVKFKQLYPHLSIKEDKDTKSNFRIQYLDANGVRRMGGNRYSTSVGGTLVGFHAHFLLVDDPLKPDEAVSDLKLATANRWMSQTLSTRKIDKRIAQTILIMQRLHQDDPAGHLLEHRADRIKHICLPGETRRFAKYVRPVEMINNYIDGLLDPKRLSWAVLENMESELGQYGYAGQVGQNPVPPGGGMFRTENFRITATMPSVQDIAMIVRYWDKASTQDGGAYTCGVKMCKLKNREFIIMHVVRGQWATNRREQEIRRIADEIDGNRVIIYHEQEPGSGGKDSAQATIRNLAGYVNYADRPTGDKASRADPYSVQVNNGNVALLQADWNREFIKEHGYFPFSRYKDQVDAASGAFTKLCQKREVRRIT